MNWERAYIVQTYENAANNLRMNSRRLVNYTLIREFLTECDKMEAAIDEMKKITEFAKFAVKFDKVIEFARSVPDFVNLGTEMNKQINDLISVVREMLDEMEPEELAEKIETVKRNLSLPVSENDNVYSPREETEKEFRTDKILEVVNLIRNIDEYLNLCVSGSISGDDKEKFMEIVNRMNALLSDFSDSLIVEMKNIFNALFGEIISRGVSRSEEIEAMRACLIVIVAKLKNKDVDISQFIELARRVELRKEEE